MVALGLLCSIGCRQTEVWSGVRLQSSSRVLAMASRTSLCACLNFHNSTKDPVYIEASHDDATTGGLTVPAGATIGQRFDWAGPKPRDFYLVRAWTTDGVPLQFGTAVTYTVSSWADCDKTACQFEPMMMDVALTGRNPGDR
jgi:hypothetical protein